MILSGVFVLLACAKLWINCFGLPDLSKNDSIFFIVRQAITSGYLWDYPLMAAAGILLVKAFVVNMD